MGGGSWTTSAFTVYTSSTKNCTVDALENTAYSAQEFYHSKKIADELNPYNVIRECRDSEEHPNTFPVILALDVTGSMGDASVRVAQKLNQIMTDIYNNRDVKDVEFCVMGIGDVAYDRAPIQISQFESDVRIAEQLDKVFFEGGGGGNYYESYTAAWYMGVHHCELDCWKRGEKGVIITLGDELPNPSIPRRIGEVVGDSLQGDVETKELVKEATEKFNIYHVSVDDRSSSYRHMKDAIDGEWKKLLGSNYRVSNLDSLAGTISDIIAECANGTRLSSNSEASW